MNDLNQRLSPAQAAIRHRIRGHRAALLMAAQADLPDDHIGVLDTLVRINEARLCLDAVRHGEQPTA